MHIYYKMLQNILPYIIIESKWQHVSLQYIYHPILHPYSSYCYTSSPIFLLFFSLLFLTTGTEALIHRRPRGGGGWEGEAPLIFFFNILVYIYALNLAILFYKITFFPYNNIFDSFYNNFTNTNLSTTFLYTVEVQILISSHLSLSLTSLFYLPIITHYINNISLALSSF